MSVHMVVCPTCDGSGIGSASMRGATCAAGQCPDCRATGEVTEEKRERLERKRDAEQYSSRLDVDNSQPTD